MYSRRAKYKQVADIDWLGQDLMELLARNHMDREMINEQVRADYYWLPGIGLYLIMDVKGKDILSEYRGYKQLFTLPIDNYGTFICSNE